VGGGAAGRATSTGSAASEAAARFDTNADVMSLAAAALQPDEIRRLTGWYDGPTLLDALTSAKPPPRMLVDKPLRLCISDVYKAGTLVAAGRLEGGFLEPHTAVMVAPGHTTATVKHLAINGRPVAGAAAGDNVDVGLGGIEEGAVHPGQVLCWPSHPIRPITRFKAQVAVFPTLAMPIVPGQQFMLHSHILEEPCNVTRVLRTLRDGHTAAIKPRCLVAGDGAVVRIPLPRPPRPDTLADHRRPRRLLLRYPRQTVAAGLIPQIPAEEALVIRELLYLDR